MAILAFAAVVGYGAAAAGIATFATAFSVAYAVGSFAFRPSGPSSHSSDQILADLRLVGTEYGQSIPWIQGVMPVAGQIWWNTDRRPIYTTVTQDVGGGKGGGDSDVSHTNITYEIDCLLGLCDTQIKGVTRIWRNGELLFNANGNATIGTIEASATTGAWRRLTAYSGASDQLPDPTYEAAVGTGNAPAYRNRGTVFIEGLNLGQSGTMVNLVFEVVVEGTSAPLQFSPAANYLVPDGYTPMINTKRHLWMQTSDGSALKVINRSTGVTLQSITWPGPWNQLRIEGADPRGTIWLSNFTGGTTCKIWRMWPQGLLQYFNVNGTAGLERIQYIRENMIYARVSSSNISVLVNINWFFNSCQTSNPFNFSPSWAIVYPMQNGAFHEGRLYVYSSINTQSFRFGYYNETTGASVVVFDLGVIMLTEPILDQNGNIWWMGFGVTHSGPFQIVKMDKDGNFITSITLPFSGGASAPGTLTTGWQITVTSANTIFAYAGATHLDPRMFWAIDANTNTLLYSAGPWPVGSDDTRTYVPGPLATPQFVYRLRTGATLDEIYIAGDDRNIDVVTATYPTVQTVVNRICERCGLQTSQYDTTDLASITQPVRGFVWPGGSSAREALEQLATAYYFEVTASDKLYFRRRGGAAVATIPYTDLGAGADVRADEDALQLALTSDIELPSQVSVKYMNALDDYQADIQMSDRLISAFSDTVSAVTLQMSLTPEEAKAIATAIVLDQAASRVSTRINVLADYTRVEPTDVVNITGPDGSVYRMRQVRRTENFPVIEMELISDAAEALSSVGITSNAYNGSTVVPGRIETVILLLDIPILRDVDDNIGFYAVTKGETSPYPGSTVMKSTDDVTFTNAAMVTTEGKFGLCTSVLADWTQHRIFDTDNTVTVDVQATLTSSTRDAVLASATTNAILIGNEIIQFITATPVSATIYTLSGLLRGCRGTEWAMTGHQVLERAVLLIENGMSRVQLTTPDIGNVLYYKGVTYGQLVTEVPSQLFTCNVVGLKPFSPWDLRGVRDSSFNVILTWQRRSRLSVRMVGPAGISVPLDDTVEAYDLELWSSGYTLLRRAVRVNGSPTFTYTTAMQTADGVGLGSTVFARIYQVHTVAGRGTVLQASA